MISALPNQTVRTNDSVKSCLRSTSARRIVMLMVAVVVVAGLLWVASAYLQPGLRKSIVYAGFGLC